MKLTVVPFRNQIFPSDDFVTAGLEGPRIATSRIPSALSNVVEPDYSLRVRRPRI